MDAAAQGSLLAWYAARRRDLPWRAEAPDPYATWVSEMMLQQTRVATVVPYFQAWMQQFPTIADLAAASEDEVLAAWSGLGYYTRARNLHKGAIQVMANGGRLPNSAEELAAIPGIGPYTAGAIASIAFGRRVPCVDGNVIRVAARHQGLSALMDGKGRRAVEGLAASWVESAPGSPGDWNQAVMELGATVCTPRSPACKECPIAVSCKARATDSVAALPRLPARTPARVDPMHFAYIVHDDALLLVRQPADGLLAGTFGLPGGPQDDKLNALVRKQTGVTVRGLTADPAARLKHQFTHRTWEMAIHVVRLRSRVEPGEKGNLETRWADLANLGSLPMSTAARKAIGAVQEKLVLA